MNLRYFFSIVLVALFLPAFAPTEPQGGITNVDAARCFSLKLSKWSAQEHWVWHQICYGYSADLNDYSERQEEHILSSNFIQLILTNPTYAHAVFLGKYQVLHAHFIDDVNLNRPILMELWFDGSQFDGDLNLDGAVMGYPLSLDGVNVRGTLSLDSFSGFSITMKYARAGEIQAWHMRLTAGFGADGVTVAGPISLYESTIGGDATFSGSIQSLEAIGAHLHFLSLQALFVADNIVFGSFGTIDQFNANLVSIGNSSIKSTSNCTTSSISSVDSGSMEFGSVYLTDIHACSTVNMKDATVKAFFAVTNGTFTDISTPGHVGRAQVIGAQISGMLDFNSVNSEGIIFVESVRVNSIDFRGARIGAEMHIFRSTIHKDLNINSMYAAANVFFEDTGVESALARSVDGRNAVIRGELVIDQERPGRRPRWGPTDLRGITVDQLVTIQSISFARLAMRQGRFNSDLQIEDVDSSEGISMDSTVVGSSVMIRNVSSANSLSLESVTVGANLTISDSALKIVSLANARIARTLSITRSTTTANSISDTLILRNATAETIEDRGSPCYQPGMDADCPNPWPHHIELLGFRYNQLGSVDVNQRSGPGHIMADRSYDWWKKYWLIPADYFPEEYEYLASVLKSYGNDDVATSIYLMRRDQDVSSLPWGLRRVWMMAYKELIDYGYVLSYAILWSFLFFFIGVVVLHASGEARRLKMRYGLSYSFDMLVPLISLNKDHESVQLLGPARYYFYAHKIAGFILASFFVAWLTGLAH